MLALAAVLVASGCIEPAPGAGSRHAEPDRARAQPFLVRAPRPGHPAHAVFGQVIELVGYDLVPATAERGQRSTLTLYWRSLEQTEGDYRVFVHVDTPEGTQRISADHDPAGGSLPTSAWRPGDLVRDPVQFTVTPSITGEALQVWIGWYDDERLPITDPGSLRRDGENRLLLTTVPVR